MAGFRVTSGSQAAAGHVVYTLGQIVLTASQTVGWAGRLVSGHGQGPAGHRVTYLGQCVSTGGQ